MQRTSWVTIEAVSGESHYVGELVKAVDEVVSTVREHIEHKKYLRNFYDKAARWVIISVYGIANRCCLQSYYY